MSIAWQVVVAATAACVLVQGVFLLGLLAKSTAVLAQMQAMLGTVNLSETFRGLNVGEQAPSPQSHTLLAGPSPQSLAGSLVLFAMEDCDPCKALLRDLTAHKLPPSVGAVLVVPNADAGTVPAPAGWSVLAETDHSWTRAFRVRAVPYVYAVGDDGRVAAAGVPGSVDDIERMLWEAMPSRLFVNGPTSARSGG
jgi:hypothetical protein